MTAELRISQMKSRNPDALRLAQLSGFAVRLEPTLLRTLRQKFIPGSDPSAEIDLWHSRLVQSRSSSAAVFDVEVLAWLRNSLTQDARCRDAYDVTRDCFKDHPPLHRLEIELNALAILDPGIKDADIERKFEPLLAELRLGGAAAQRVARWLLQAAPRWHPRVRGTGSAWASLIAASAVLDGRRILDGAPPAEVGGERLAQALPPTLAGTRRIGVIHAEGRLRFVAAELPEVATIEIPAYSPLLLLVEMDGQAPIVVNVQPEMEVALPNDGAVTLRSLLGDAWRIEYIAAKHAAREPGAEVTNDAAEAEPDAESAQSAHDVVTGEAQSNVPEDAGRKVIILIGHGRRDFFEAIAVNLDRMVHDPVMPEHFMGDPKALPSIRKLLQAARFVVIDEALPSWWLETWSTAFREHPKVPVVPILCLQNKSEKWDWKDLPSLLPGVHFENADQLSKVAISRIIGPAEDMRRRSPPEQSGSTNGLKVYLSSSFEDLPEYRQAAISAVGLPHRVIAADTYDHEKRPLESMLEPLQQCDVFVFIVSQKYGYIPPEERDKADPRSILELEYTRARELGKPVIAFRVHGKGFESAILGDETGGLGLFHERLETEAQAVLVSAPREMEQFVANAVRVAQLNRESSVTIQDQTSRVHEQTYRALEAVNLPTLQLSDTTTAIEQESEFQYSPSSLPKVIVASGHLIEFRDDVPLETRNSVANVLLLAQLAADHSAHVEPQSAWLDNYFGVLATIGWVVAIKQEGRDPSTPLNEILGSTIVPHLKETVEPELASVSPLFVGLSMWRPDPAGRSWYEQFIMPQLPKADQHYRFAFVECERDETRIRMLSCTLNPDPTDQRRTLVPDGSWRAETGWTIHSLIIPNHLLDSTAELVTKRVAPFRSGLVKPAYGILRAMEESQTPRGASA
jgi:hypothetical protein